MWLFVAFLAVPLIEIALFIQIGGWIGLWPTLAIVVLTAVLGTWLVRSQGFLAMQNLRGSFSRLQDPTEPLAHGAMILFAGALLLTPGFFTDAVGFALLAPPVRSAVYAWARARVKVAHFDMGSQSGGFEARTNRPHHHSVNDDVIDAEFESVDDITPPKRPTHRPSGWTKH